ncbi:FAD/NAD(P)-binding domain-containing protein [Hypoxylon rubiginosum]|uniref:FAD/NAD(P)-binding domain-containing protein n=1 Tax=Hypoxylon rubiginosum TaxID=110542 RepID=A0ACB9YVB8_9PEZI|nr:FAD/NAD(P)-binding domain-containing protein [Hypoxylon rubiginosum]
MRNSTVHDLPILIIGAGVAGLTLAQGLRLRSIYFRLFERYPRSRASQGHRFRISNDGQAALNSVLSPQLQDLLRNTAAKAQCFEPRYVDPRKLDFAKPMPVNPGSMPVDRTLIRMLTSLDIEDSIEYDKEFESYNVTDEQVQVKFADGSMVCGQLLVGADGVRSRVRKQLQPNRKLLDLERWILWGRTPLTEDLRRDLPQDILSWCMYMDQDANVQAVVEPMVWPQSVRQESKARLPDFPDYVYWCVGTASFQYSERLPKTVEEKRLFLKEATKDWHPALKLLFDSAAHDLSACVPILSSKPDIEIGSASQTGRVTLIGDAAHAMSPMGGSGGDTAIRSAADLARTVAEEGITKRSIAEFEARMEERARMKIEHSFSGGRKYWRGKQWTEYTEVDV